MRKNVLMGMFAAATMLFATSCQKEEMGTEVPVSFSLTQPGIATKAYSDGLTATKLSYAVYETGTTTALITSEREVEFTDKQATVNLQLVTGMTYDIIFWADAENSPYTFDAATKTITVDYVGTEARPVVSQDETRDAFFGSTTIEVDGAISKPVTLYRPFAQLNIGTTDAAAAAEAGFTPSQSSVTVSNVYSTLNLLTGEVSNLTEVTFGMAALPGENEQFPYATEDITPKYLSMNYLLVQRNEDNELVDIDFTVTNGTHTIEREFSNVPVNRNYRTNIYGKLLTKDADFTIIIDEKYEVPDFEFDADANTDTEPNPSVDLGIMVNGESVLFAPTVYGATEDNPYGTYMTVAEAANVEGYRLPTAEEYRALIAACNIERVEENGVAGYRFTSRTTGNAIFFPLIENNSVGAINGYLYYPSSTVMESPVWNECMNTMDSHGPQVGAYFNITNTLLPIYLVVE